MFGCKKEEPSSLALKIWNIFEAVLSSQQTLNKSVVYHPNLAAMKV